MDIRVSKRTGTYADALEAVGVASLLAEAGHGGAVSLRDCGAEFLISTPTGIADWEDIGPGFPYIWERTKEKRPPGNGVLDYESEREKREAFRNWENAKRKAKGAAEAQDLEGPAQPAWEIDLAVILASMRKGWNGDRQLWMWLRNNPTQATAWAKGELRLGDRVQGPEITNTQILNPIAGKGVHSAKTQLRSPGSVPAQLVDSFREWMKLRGMWRGLLPYRSGDDFKFFVLEPGDITIAGIELLKRAVHDLNLWGGVKLDISAALRCTEMLIRHSGVVQNRPPAGHIRLRNRKPRAVVSGLRQAYFKSLGTAAALMNDCLLPLPDWFAVDGPDDARDYLAIIEEALGETVGRGGGCLASLNEQHSSDGATLQQYRQWLLGGELHELLEFHYRFAIHVMACLAAKQRVRPFATENLDKLLTKTYRRDYPVKEILEDDGFQSVARAVRNTTIYARTLENRDVRFGLAQQWKQKMKAGDREFLAALCEFVQEQNWEVVHVLKGKGHVVTTGHLDSVAALIDNYGAGLVGSMLLAYGYSRAPKVESEEAKVEALDA